MEGNVNKNEVALETLPEYEGKKLLKILSHSIGEGENDLSYMCVNEDGDKVVVPASVIQEAVAAEQEAKAKADKKK